MVEAALRTWSRPPTAKATTSRGCGPGSPTAPPCPHPATYYGRPVNLASRLTGDRQTGQRPGRHGDPRGGGGGGFEYSFAGERRLKGIDARVKQFRVRRAASASA